MFLTWLCIFIPVLVQYMNLVVSNNYSWSRYIRDDLPYRGCWETEEHGAIVVNLAETTSAMLADNCDPNVPKYCFIRMGISRVLDKYLYLAGSRRAQSSRYRQSGYMLVDATFLILQLLVRILVSSSIVLRTKVHVSEAETNKFRNLSPAPEQCEFALQPVAGRTSFPEALALFKLSP